MSAAFDALVTLAARRGAEAMEGACARALALGVGVRARDGLEDGTVTAWPDAGVPAGQVAYTTAAAPLPGWGGAARWAG